MPAMFIVMIVLFLGANWYVLHRLLHLMPPTPVGKWVLISLYILATACIFVYFLFRNSAPGWLMAGVYKTGTSWIMIFLYFLMVLLLLDLARVTKLFPMEWMKTGSWTAFAAVILFVTVIMVIGNIVYHNKKRVELNITLDKTLAEPLRIVAVSDLHLGYGIGKKEFGRWVEMINREKPDAVLIAGDIIDSDIRPLYAQGMAEVFGRFDTRYGVFAVPGNHEYITGIDKSLGFLNETGITVLRDSVTLVGNSLYIAGRDDSSNGERSTPQRLFERLDMSKPIIFLDHQPYNLGDAVQAGADIQVSGHTHRGQVWPISWITDAIYEKSHGYLQKDNTHFFVSSGLGIWGGKFRIGSRSEYVVINITGIKQ